MPADHAGEAIDRRTVLRRALRTGAAAGLTGFLAACGSTSSPPPRRSDYFFAYGDGNGGPITNPPFGDLVRLIDVRARELNVAPVITESQGATIDYLRSNAGPGQSRDSQTGTYLPAYDVVVCGFPVSSQVEAIATAAIRSKIKVVGFLQALEEQTAAIAVKPASLGALLATHAVDWALRERGGEGTALLVGPSSFDIGPNRERPYASQAPDAMRALRATLARRAPRLRVVTADVDVASALRAHPDAAIVLCWSDAIAVGAATALRALHPSGRDKLYAGGLGMPTLASRDSVVELRRDDVLRAVAAVDLRALANAAVDLPTTLLLGEPGGDIVLEPRLLTPGSRELAESERDFAVDPMATLAAIRRRTASAGSGYILSVNRQNDARTRPPMRDPASRPAPR